MTGVKLPCLYPTTGDSNRGETVQDDSEYKRKVQLFIVEWCYVLHL